MRIDNATLRRIIKEELDNVMVVANAPDPTSALEEAISLQQEGLSGILAAFAAALSINSTEIPDNAKFNVNGNSVTIEQIATAYDMLEKVSQKPEMSKYAELGQGDLIDIVEDSLAKGDADGDGIYGSQNSLKDMQSANTNYEFGEAYADMALDRVLEKSQASTPTQAADSVDTSNFDINKGQSPQGNDQLTVNLPKGKKLSQDEISQITKSNGMSSYSVANNTGLGMVIITSN